jgi:hypothetical protein
MLVGKRVTWSEAVHRASHGVTLEMAMINDPLWVHHVATVLEVSIERGTSGAQWWLLLAEDDGSIHEMRATAVKYIHEPPPM